MANLSILSGIEFYSYDVEVYDKTLAGVIRYKDSQVAKFKEIDSSFFENKNFYGINRSELVKEFIKYLSRFDSKINKDSFLLGDVVDKRIIKGKPYVNDIMIFKASAKQYDAQAKSIQAKVEAPKEALNDIEFYSYDVEVYDKVLSGIIRYNDSQVAKFKEIDSSFFENKNFYGKNRDELVNEFIKYLSRFDSKINNNSFQLGNVVDKRIKKGASYANDTTIFTTSKQSNVQDKQSNIQAKSVQAKVETTATLKKLVKNLTTMVKKVGFNEEEIDGRIMSIIPNAKPEGVGVGGNKVDLSYTLPWVLDKAQVKKKKFAEEVAETSPSNIVIKEVGLTLYILDEVEGEINISISADVKWINTFFGTTELDSYTLVEQVVPIQEATSVSFETWAKKHKYGYTEAKAFFQVRDIIPNYDGDAIVYKSGKSNYIAIPNDVEGIDGFIDAVKHAYTPEKSGAFYRFYFTNLDMMQDFVDFANKIDKPDKQDLGGVAFKSLAAEFNDHDLFINSDTFKTVKNILLSDGFNQTDINGYVSFIKDNTQHGYSAWIKLRKNNKFDAHITVTNTDHLKVLIDSLKGLKFTKTDDLTIKFANDTTFSKIMVNSTLNIIKKFDSSLDVFTVTNTPQPDKQDLGIVKPKEEIEPSNREVERTFKASKVQDPEHKEQLNRMKAYVKKIADIVDADNDFALRFLEEPKEFQKYKLPTVGLGLFYYGDKSATELEQNALYKKVYRGRGLSILRKFFKTTDLNGEKCLLVLFVDAQYAKETKAKLIKESFELGNKVRINGRLYKVNAIYERKFAIETIAGLMYIDMDSDLIDITIGED